MKLLRRNEIAYPNLRPIKVVQFGAGNFLRGFADWIIDVMNENNCFDGDIQIIQSVSSQKNSLNDQQGLYHVVIRGIQNRQMTEQLRLISAVRGSVNAHEDPKAFFDIAGYESLQLLISNTTEAGIVFEEEAFNEGLVPKTFPGKVAALLYERFRKGLNPLVILPCELIEENGSALRRIILQYAQHWALGDEFSEWIVSKNTFCNTLVDRIVPGNSDALAENVLQSTGYADAMAVMAEPYHFWAIEAPASVQEILPADKCGLNVVYTNNLSYYRERKVRILNGAHTALMPIAYLNGFRLVRECLADEKTRAFISSIIFDEIIPTLSGEVGDLAAFAETVIDRFANPFVEHKLASISLNSIAKFRVRILPTVEKYYQLRKSLPQGLMRSFAALMIFYRGHWRNEKIEIKDEPRVVAFFQEVWNHDDISVVARLILENSELWNPGFSNIPGMHAALSSHMNSILSDE